MPRLTQLLVYDSSSDADPDAGKHQQPKLLLRMTSGRGIRSCNPASAPQ